MYIKKEKVIITVLIAVAVIAAAVVYALKIFDNHEYEIVANLYFFNDKKTAITEEVRKIKYDAPDDTAELIIAELMKGSPNKKYISPLGRNVKILKAENNDGEYTLDLSREFLSGDNAQDILAAYAVIKSLCSANDVQRAKVMVENKDIVAPDGNTVGFLSSSEINICQGSDSSGVVALYFPSKSTQKLVVEWRSIGGADKKTKEQYIVNELIKGTQDKNLMSVIASDTVLISAETKDGVCYLNFKSSFMDKNTGSQEKEQLVLFSIVNSLTELENVNQVQFLVDGKKVNNFGSTYIGDLFYRNEELMESK